MTVQELIAKLREMPQDLPVYAEGVTDECEWRIGAAEHKTIEVGRYEQVRQGEYSWGRHWKESVEAVLLDVAS